MLDRAWRCHDDRASNLQIALKNYRKRTRFVGGRQNG
jgi:hypothetical protein